MYGFIKEISQTSGIPFDVLGTSFKVCLLGENVLTVSNFVKILAYSEEEIILKVKGNNLKITGENLQISQLSPKEIILKGKVFGLLLEKNAGKKR